MEHQETRLTRELKLLTEFRENPSDETFRPLYESTKDLVYTICYRILRNQEDAVDAFQATYCRVVASAGERGRRKADADAPATVHRLAVREAQSLRQRRARRAKKEIAMPCRSLPDGRPRPEQLASDQELRGLIESLACALPERYRLPLVLHFFHGLSYSEIAGVLAKPIGTVSSTIARALRKLDPAMRRAGLVDSASVLGAVAAGSHLLSPPESLGASVVLSTAEAALGSSAPPGASDRWRRRRGWGWVS
jgi:RNA polymerase sigma factor (sigma-70 family)